MSRVSRIVAASCLALVACNEVSAPRTLHPDLVVEPGQLSFEPHSVGCEPASLTFAVRNDGDVAGAVVVGAIRSVDDAFFYVGAGAGDFDVEPDDELAFTVEFRPNRSGSNAGTIEVDFADNQPGRPTSRVVDLDGVGVGDEDGDGLAEACGDCDDTDAATFPGAAPLDSATDCMTDADGDDYGDHSPAVGVTAGSDCDDTDPDIARDDDDGDGWTTCDGDNCPDVANPAQDNGDTDPLGDACDNCPAHDNAGQEDDDGDGFGNACDVCEGYDDAVDVDGDAVPDGCDPCPLDDPDDTDGDGVCDTDDECPDGDDSVDTDGDGVADACDWCPLDNPDDTDGDAVCDSDDLCPGSDDAIDSDGDGVPDGCDGCDTTDYYVDLDNDGVGAGDPVPLCPEDVPVGCNSLPYVELDAVGDVEVPTECAPGDYDCQAWAVCEYVTGTTCIYQHYDCGHGTTNPTVDGSYYPLGTVGIESLNFAVGYDFIDGHSLVTTVVEEGGVYGGYSNICCFDGVLCGLYDIREDHTFAGSGHWGLDADGIGALSGDDCADRPYYVPVDGDPCPTDPLDECVVMPTCLDVLTDDPSAPSGTYTLDVDGAGPGAAIDVYCDMDTLGGGWTLCGKFDRDNAGGQSSLTDGFARSLRNEADLADITAFSSATASHDCRALIDAGATEILSAGTDGSGPPWTFGRINNILAETVADPTDLWDIAIDEDGVCACTSDAIITWDLAGVDLGNSDPPSSLQARAMCLGDGGMWSNNSVRTGAHFGNAGTADCTGSGEDTVFWAWEGSAGDLDSHDCGPHFGGIVVGTGCNQDGGWEFPPTYRYNLMFFR